MAQAMEGQEHPYCLIGISHIPGGYRICFANSIARPVNVEELYRGGWDGGKGYGLHMVRELVDKHYPGIEHYTHATGDSFLQQLNIRG